MKTSNKLLLGFIIFVFLVPVCASFVLKGVIKKNKYTTALYPSADYYQQGTFGNYKVIKIVNNDFPSNSTFICTLHTASSGRYLFYDCSNDEGIFDSIDVKIKDDTLLVQRFTLSSAGMRNTHQSDVGWMQTRNIDLFLPSLDNVIAEKTSIKIDSSTAIPINIFLNNGSLVLGNLGTEVKIENGKSVQDILNRKSNFGNVKISAVQSPVALGSNVCMDSLSLNMDGKSFLQISGDSNVRALNGSIDKQSNINADSIMTKRLMSLVK